MSNFKQKLSFNVKALEKLYTLAEKETKKINEATKKLAKIYIDISKKYDKIDEFEKEETLTKKVPMKSKGKKRACPPDAKKKKK